MSDENYFLNMQNNFNQNNDYSRRPIVATKNIITNNRPIQIYDNLDFRQTQFQGGNFTNWAKGEDRKKNQDVPKDSTKNIFSEKNIVKNSICNIYSPKKVYIILKKDMTQQPFYSKMATINLNYNSKIYSTSEEISSFIKNNIEFSYFNEEQLKKLRIDRSQYNGKEVLLYEIGDKSFLLFSQEDNKILEIKNNEKDSSKQESNKDEENLKFMHFKV